ncbi:unnamed protein product, partial [Brassica oleracea var. botrytis]
CCESNFCLVSRPHRLSKCHRHSLFGWEGEVLRVSRLCLRLLPISMFSPSHNVLCCCLYQRSLEFRCVIGVHLATDGFQHLV